MESGYVVSDLHLFTTVGPVKKFGACENIAGIIARHAESQSLMRTYTHKDGLVILPKLIESRILSDVIVALQLHTQIQNLLDFWT